jgi:hypothetical protein
MTQEAPQFAWAIIAATFLGPIFAVLLTRYVDARRDQHNRRMHVVRTLMATRRSVLAPEHIAALNLIEIEFYRKKRVLEAWKAYFQHLCTPFEPKDEERITRERALLRVKLLSEMAKVVGYRIEQLEIIEGGYTPQWTFDVEAQQHAVRQLFVEIAGGKRSLPIEVVNLPKQP